MELLILCDRVKALQVDLGSAENILAVLESRFVLSRALISVCRATTRWEYT